MNIQNLLVALVIALTGASSYLAGYISAPTTIECKCSCHPDDHKPKPKPGAVGDGL